MTESMTTAMTASMSASTGLASGFWDALTEDEQQAFLARAREEELPAGHVLWREGDLADHLVVIRSGAVTVLLSDDGPRPSVVVRGPGDLIGERAALPVPLRSATAVAACDLRVLRMPVGAFFDYIAGCPRVVSVLERQMYERIVEADATAPVPVCETGVAGQVCTVVFVDVVGFSAAHRDDSDRLELRDVLYRTVEGALDASGVSEDGCHREDRGDGMLVVVPPDVPPADVAHRVPAALAAGLRRHNRRASEVMRLRVRLSVHVGPVRADGRGVSGLAVVHAARLLDAPALRSRVAASRADVGFIVSDYVYQYVLAQGPDRVDGFDRVRCRVKGTQLTGWIRLT